MLYFLFCESNHKEIFYNRVTGSHIFYLNWYQFKRDQTKLNYPLFKEVE